jgi:predicted DNA-binding transcriptional regulator AlpA
MTYLGSKVRAMNENEPSQSSNPGYGAQLTVDIKGVVAITGFCRQRVSQIRKDPSLGFPEPIRVGRSLRWFTCDIVGWLRAKQAGNARLMAEFANINIQAHRAPATLKRKSTWLLLGKTRKPLLKDIEAENQLALDTLISPGQYRISSEVATEEGVRVRRHRIGGLASKSSTAAIEVGYTRKVMFSPGTTPEQRMRYWASKGLGRNGEDSAGPQAAGIGSGVEGVSGSISTETVSLEELKSAYESGKSLDALCKQHRMGKSRVSKLLRSAGANMRPAGRKPKVTSR